jgi:hypothetical protein
MFNSAASARKSRQGVHHPLKPGMMYSGAPKLQDDGAQVSIAGNRHCAVFDRSFGDQNILLCA